ncbi:MAG: carboxymuconolactone decarboxylase family protein [Oscillospiraceae bacterium]|jgi:alkylhydroperoxidase/carboxymuconolactone decarboxylase family protein YurZ|nr:carboxymuconolactone decarboxylase family protein [Oscillospiraceae bacterium]
MAESKNFFQAWGEEAPETMKAYMALSDSLSSLGGVDAKTWQLLYIAIQASRREVGSVVGHTMFAKQAGATREEVRDAILISLMATGIGGPNECLVPALEAYDR